MGKLLNTIKSIVTGSAVIVQDSNGIRYIDAGKVNFNMQRYFTPTGDMIELENHIINKYRGYDLKDVKEYYCDGARCIVTDTTIKKGSFEVLIHRTDSYITVTNANIKKWNIKTHVKVADNLDKLHHELMERFMDELMGGDK